MRQAVVQDRSRGANRIEKLLQSYGAKLSSVASNIMGVSGRLILGAIARGESDPAKLAGLGEKLSASPLGNTDMSTAVAVAQKIPVAAYHILRDKTPYLDPGEDYFDRLHADRTVQRLTKRFRQLGSPIRPRLRSPIQSRPSKTPHNPGGAGGSASVPNADWNANTEMEGKCLPYLCR